MDNLNKVFSFVLGLAVVVVILVVLATRFNLRERILPLSKNDTKIALTPTPTPKGQVKRVITPAASTGKTSLKSGPYITSQPSAKSNGSTKGGLTAIPNTGLPTFVLPATFLTLLAGAYLSRKS